MEEEIQITMASNTKINDIKDEFHRERIRREILDNIKSKAEEENNAFRLLFSYLSVICTGGAVSILSYIAVSGNKSVFSLLSLGSFFLSILSLSIFAYKYFQLMSLRCNNYSNTAQLFFFREKSLEDLFVTRVEEYKPWFFRLIFWVPISFFFFGFIFGSLSVYFFTPK